MINARGHLKRAPGHQYSPESWVGKRAASLA